MVAPEWVVQHPHSARERDATNRAHGIFGLPPGPTKGQAQQVPGFDRYVRVAARAPPLARPGRMPSRERLGRHPDCEAAALLECPVVLWPVADLVARPGDLVAARLIGLVGHRASGKRGSGPIRSTLPQPKPKARNFAPTPPSTAIGRASPGAICPSGSAVGSRCKPASVAGPRPAYGSGCSSTWRSMPTTSTP